MSSPYSELAKRIRRETSDLDRVVTRTIKSWQRSKTITVDHDIYMDSTALGIHDFYSGIERMLEQVARRIDGTVPSGADWHHQLLVQASQEWMDVRPAVISQQSALDLDEFRRFRHVVRNVYAEHFIPERIKNLVEHMSPLWTRMRQEVHAFAEFLMLLDSEIGGE